MRLPVDPEQTGGEWSRARAGGWLGVAALASLVARLGEAGGQAIWLVPVALVVLAVRASRRELMVAWVALAVVWLVPDWPGATRPLGWAPLEAAVLLAGARRLAHRHRALPLALGVGCLRVAIELLPGYPDTATWGACRLPAPGLAQLMHLGGVALLSFVIAAGGASVGLLIADLERPGALRAVALAAAVLALSTAIGINRIELGSTEKIKLAAVVAEPEQFERFVRLTEKAVAAEATVVAWPLTALRVEAVELEAVREELSGLAIRLGVWLAAGLRESDTGVVRRLLATPSGHCYIDSEVEPPLDLASPWFGGLAVLDATDLADGATVAALAERGVTVFVGPSAAPRPDARQTRLWRLRAIENAVAVAAVGATDAVIGDPFGRVVTEHRAEGEICLVREVRIVRPGDFVGLARARFPRLAALLALLLLVVPTWRPAREEYIAPPDPSGV